MMWLRRVILCLPLLLALFFATAFLSVRVAPPKKLNQYVVGSIGEPDTLNPILSTSKAASDVEVRVFNGLIRFDENLELEGNLARSWSITQTSFLYFADTDQTAQALEKLHEHHAEWATLKLTSAIMAGTAVQLKFETAGTGYREHLFGWLGELTPQKVTQLAVTLDTEKSFPDGRKVNLTTALEAIKHALGDGSGLLERVIYTWHFGNTAYLEILVHGEPEPIVAEVNRLLQFEEKKEGETEEQAQKQEKDDDKALGACKIARSSFARDEPEIVFLLRKGVRWHDGEPFTAADVLFTYESLMDEKVASPRRSSYEDVRQVVTPDPYTVRVTYKHPYSPAANSWAMDMLPRHILAGHDTKWWADNFNRAPIGTGPYMLEQWKSNEQIILRKNPDYWEGAPHLDRLVIRFIPDPLALRLAFETKEIDMLGMQPHALGGMLQNPDYEIFSDLYPSYSYVGWNLKRSLFQDARVRHALAHAVNIPEIIQYVLYGQGVQSRGIYHPNYFWANNGLALLEYNPERARALLAEAGWSEKDEDGYLVKDGKRFAFTLITNQGNDIRKDIATIIQGQLKKLGIAVKVEIYEWTVFLKKHIDAQEFDACVLGWTSPANFDQYQLWHSSQTNPGELNFISYKNPEVDRLIELVRSEFDREKIKKYCHKIQEIIYGDQPYIFLYVPHAAFAIHKGSFRVRRPDGTGGWIDEPIRQTKGGFDMYDRWWYRPEYTFQAGSSPELRIGDE